MKFTTTFALFATVLMGMTAAMPFEDAYAGDLELHSEDNFRPPIGTMGQFSNEGHMEENTKNEKKMAGSELKDKQISESADNRDEHLHAREEAQRGPGYGRGGYGYGRGGYGYGRGGYGYGRGGYGYGRGGYGHGRGGYGYGGHGGYGGY